MTKNSCSQPSVVLLSGGLDSATVLAIAIDQGFDCYCLSVDYGQRSQAELNAARLIAAKAEAKHRVVHFDLAQFGHSALTDQTIAVPTGELSVRETIPITYVPARNTIMLSLSLAWAEVIQAQAIFIGVNAIDYSGYPDCRPEFIATFEHLANLATRSGVEGNHLSIQAPLQNLSKAEIIRQGIDLGVDYAITVSCYQANEQGYACGLCEACRLRRQGFAEAGFADPTRYMASSL